MSSRVASGASSWKKRSVSCGHLSKSDVITDPSEQSLTLLPISVRGKRAGMITVTSTTTARNSGAATTVAPPHPGDARGSRHGSRTSRHGSLPGSRNSGDALPGRGGDELMKLKMKAVSMMLVLHGCDGDL